AGRTCHLSAGITPFPYRGRRTGTRHERRAVRRGRGDRDDIVIPPLTGSYTVRYDSTTSCLYLENGGLPPAWNTVWPRGSRPVADGHRRGVEVPGAGGVLEVELVVVTRATIELATREQREHAGGDLGVEGLARAWDSCGPKRSLRYVFTIAHDEEEQPTDEPRPDWASGDSPSNDPAPGTTPAAIIEGCCRLLGYARRNSSGEAGSTPLHCAWPTCAARSSCWTSGPSAASTACM